jgi:hypothetical protein
MVTRRQAGKVIRPRERLNLNTMATGVLSPIPKTVRTALKDPNWLDAMQAEYGALMSNN